jgi:hypothetical protein
MHWIIQENLYHESGWTGLVDTLERFKIPHSFHKVVPFVGDLIPEPPLIEGKVICMGSYSMRRAAKKYGWSPGVYDIYDQDFLVQREHWGDFLLNYDALVTEFKNVILTEPKFIRPTNDSKHFAGRVFQPDEWNEWRHKIIDLGHDYGNELTPDTLVQVCEPKEIWAEYRFWIVRDHVATRSSYKLGSRVTHVHPVPQRVEWFARDVCDPFFQHGCFEKWQPAKAYCLDLCETPNGVKIVEINTINSSGFYGANMVDLVVALNEGMG